MSKQLVLAGDIGGTKTHLALFSVQGQKLRRERMQTYASQRYADLTPLIREFFSAEKPAIDSACFGIAGAVVDGVVKTPNLPWSVEVNEIHSALSLSSVALLNDLEAGAYGIFTLEDDEFCTLNQGVQHDSGNKALIAAGTGLGQSLLYYAGGRFHPLASEGGHGDFAPRTELEIEMLRYLIGKFGHVSYERVVSGPGLFNIYSFLRDQGKVSEPKAFAEQLGASNDPSALISHAALAGEVEICVKALDIFVSVYGAEAGNLALRGKAVRGLYIGGGIAPKILEKLKDGTFMRAFVDKGRYADLLGAIPVKVVLNDQTALQGAAYYAAFISDG